jgi:histidinol-phosphate/aromatic aminotransferase/cobyric acid decarboxylase-like protein
MPTPPRHRIRRRIAIPVPTFGRWTDQPLETGKRVDMFPLQERDGFRLTVFPSQGNFILVKLPTEWPGVALRDFLVANHGVYTRECGNKLGMTSQFMRLVVRPAADVDRLIDGLGTVREVFA